MIIVTSLNSESLFSKCFLSDFQGKAGVFKVLRFEERFQKVSFSRRITVDGNLAPRGEDSNIKITRVLIVIAWYL